MMHALAAAAADGIEAEYVQLEAKPFVARWSVALFRHGGSSATRV